MNKRNRRNQIKGISIKGIILKTPLHEGGPLSSGFGRELFSFKENDWQKNK